MRGTVIFSVLGMMLFASSQARTLKDELRIELLRELIESELEERQVYKPPVADGDNEAECKLNNPADPSPLISPGYFGEGIPANQKCLFEIRAPEGKKIKLTIDELDFEDMCTKAGNKNTFGLYILDDMVPDLNIYPSSPAKGPGFCSKSDTEGTYDIETDRVSIYIRTGKVTEGANKFKISYEFY